MSFPSLTTLQCSFFFKDHHRELHTIRSPQFLGLRNQHRLWLDSDYGCDVRIGVFDTGFVAKNYYNKLIRARLFPKGHEAAVGQGCPIVGINQTFKFMSLRDADGHGTHIASTVAGSHTFHASMRDYAAGIAKGVHLKRD
ncbi:hypothetical protein V6N11_019664 [Hibiscus sabdariffa]|uniref:Uncharacterized protein n=2 Tax=Hibiscus sabdariffa TaxID=183260 RepID=A0ABR2NLD5_9ROSI